MEKHYTSAVGVVVGLMLRWIIYTTEQSVNPLRKEEQQGGGVVRLVGNLKRQPPLDININCVYIV
jgi:hypothetical protein